MKDHPIIFTDFSVRAILAGRKTQSRRMSERWMKVKAGDRLWVRETFQPIFADGIKYSETDWKTGEGYAPVYPATDPIHEYLDANTDSLTDRCKPSIHMPRWASRITLEAVEDARREPLQDIKAWECIAEGIEGDIGNAVPNFAVLWDSINGKTAPWSSNPAPVRLAFKLLKEEKES